MGSLIQLLFSSVTGIICEKIVAAGTAVLSNHFFATVYGPRLFGELQFVLSLSMVIGSVAMVFSAESVAPVLGRHLRLRHLVFHRIFRFRLASALGVLLMFGVVAWATMDRTNAEFSLVAGMLLMVEPFSIGTLMAYAERRPWVVTRARTLASCTRVLWLLAASQLSAGAIVAAMAWPIEGWISSVGSFFRYRKLALRPPGSFRGDSAVKRALFMRGIKIWPAIIVSVMILRLDRILLGMLLSKADLGIYSAAASLVEQWNSVGTALALALAPSMVFVARNEGQLRANAARLALYLGLLGCLAFVGCVAIGHAVFVMIYGKGFEAGVPVMIFATGCAIVSFGDSGMTTCLIAARRYRLILIKQGVTLAAMLAALFLVPRSLIMYAPSAATALALAIFWFVLYGRNARRAGKRMDAAASLAQSNGTAVK